MADVLVYLYAVGGVALRSVLPGGLVGVAGAPVRVIVANGLAAVVSSVDPSQFGTEPLRRNLEDVAWLAAAARAHHAVVEAAWRGEPIAPLRLATVYVDDDKVRALLRDRGPEFRAVLDRLRGREEWAVKAYALPRPAAPDGADDDPDVGPGAAYLRRRRAVRDRDTRVRRAVQDAADQLHERLTAAAHDSRRYAGGDPRLAGRPPDLVLNAAYLVDGSATAAFRRTVEGWRSPHVRAELTGPWAPYSFATLEEP
jgi:hypothetical protein